MKDTRIMIKVSIIYLVFNKLLHIINILFLKLYLVLEHFHKLRYNNYFIIIYLS